MNHTNVGGYLRQLRKEREFSQEYVSRKLGIRRQTYSTYETGKIFPPADILVKIANFYSVSIESFYSKRAETVEFPKIREIETPRFSAASLLYDPRKVNRDAMLLNLFWAVEERDQEDILDFLKLKARQNRNTKNIQSVL